MTSRERSSQCSAIFEALESMRSSFIPCQSTENVTDIPSESVFSSIVISFPASSLAIFKAAFTSGRFLLRHGALVVTPFAVISIPAIVAHAQAKGVRLVTNFVSLVVMIATGIFFSNFLE
jgi:hypothetical protein